MIAENDQVIAVTGKNPLAAIQAKEAPALTDNDYQIKGTSADQVIKFTVNGAGALKYRIDTAQQKNAVTLGPVLRLNNFPTNATNMVFYRMPSGKYIDMNNTYTIHLAGQSANKASRDVLAPPVDPLAIQLISADDAPERLISLLPNGVVQVGDNTYRFQDGAWQQLNVTVSLKKTPEKKTVTKKKKQ